MPLVNVKYIEGLITDEAQKRELIEKLTDTFVSVCGEVTRPFLYVVIEEVPAYHWGVAGKPLPNDEFLTGKEYAGYVNKSISILSAQVGKQAVNNKQLTK